MPATSPAGTGNRVEYHHVALGLSEWYVNEPGGLEQGFTIRTAPSAGDPGRPVVLEMQYPAALVASLEDGASSVLFSTGAGDPAVRYGGLEVWDATGHELGATLAVAPGALEIRIDDTGATYPITVDPIFSSADWTADGNQQDAQFGFEVATAGDVNDDGFDDVIVGAPWYDNAYPNAGRASVYMGSPAGLGDEAAWTAELDQTAQLGFSVGTAGDVDGDTYSDVIVGAHLFDNDLTDEGAAPAGRHQRGDVPARSDQPRPAQDSPVGRALQRRRGLDRCRRLGARRPRCEQHRHAPRLGRARFGLPGPALDHRRQRQRFLGRRGRLLRRDGDPALGVDGRVRALHRLAPRRAHRRLRRLVRRQRLRRRRRPRPRGGGRHVDRRRLLRHQGSRGSARREAHGRHRGRLDRTRPGLAGHRCRGRLGRDRGADAYDITPGARNLDELGFVITTDTAQPPKKWTIMLYGAGDNDLESNVFRDANEMEWIGSNADMNLVIQFDARKKEKSHIKEWGGPESTRGGTWRGHLKRESADMKRLFLHVPPAGGGGYLGEKNMADPGELEGFIIWCVGNDPADSYALILNSHSAGWKRFGWDETPTPLTPDQLYIDELHTALRDAMGAPNMPAKLDIIGFDSCLMATVEVAYQVEEFARYMVASEEGIPLRGWPYHRFLNRLEVNPNMTAADLAKKMVEEYHAYYDFDPPGPPARKRDPWHTLSAIDLGADLVNLVTVRLDTFGEELGSGVEDVLTHNDPADNVQLKIRGHMVAAETFEDRNFIDLAHFASLVQNDPTIPVAYKFQAQFIVNALQLNNGIVVANEIGGANVNAKGLSIYFPTAQTKVPEWDAGRPIPLPPVLKREAGCWSGGKKWTNCEAPFDDPENMSRFHLVSRFEFAGDPNDCTPIWACGNPGNPDHRLPRVSPFRFAEDTEWDEFLHRYYGPVGDAGADLVAPPVQPVAFSGAGSSDADGKLEDMKFYWDFDFLTDNPLPLNCTDDDWDRDCVDELNDDKDAEGMNVQHGFLPGLRRVTLSVWDDHDRYHVVPGEHYETDQDEIVVTAQPSGAVGPAELDVERVTAVRTAGANPFHARAPLTFSLRARGHVSLRIYDVTGKLVRTLVDEVREPGWQEVAWDGRNHGGQQVTSGVYFARMVARDFNRALKLIMIR